MAGLTPTEPLNILCTWESFKALWHGLEKITFLFTNQLILCKNGNFDFLISKFINRQACSLLFYFSFVFSGIQLATRTIDLFIRHVCLLAPLNLETTRNQILTDLNQLEIALTPVCPVLSELGKPYKLLKGFKSLLSMKMEEIVASSIVGSAVSYSFAIQLLYRFSRDEMKMPHSVNGWSITRYCKWLDEHLAEIDRLNLLKAALESYVHTVRAKGQQSFCPVYPHMMTLLQKGLVSQ